MRKLNDVLKQTGKEIYREIIRIALYSVISSAALVLIIFLVPTIFALVLLPLLYMPLVYGVCYAYHRKTMTGKSGLRDVLKGAVKGFGTSALFGILCVLLGLILWSTWWYYGDKEGFMYLAIAVFQTYFVAMALVSQFYTLQLVLQEGMGIFKAMAESVKLFFRYPSYTLGACIQVVFILVPLLLTVVGFAFLFGGIWAVYQHKVSYNVLHHEEEQGESAGTAGGHEWARS
ncbi:hypothetical protein PASE110613_13400 [Paenibacillus sediminis]|uniref:Membrane protein YesL n=1 Tax=Paenibacillus sediminis TaxID=664909 RepID=A0ABS4H3Q6_9BACL|nr:hypothetical protein [Paenibacillus sediminis]MBP1937170.1 putative membrane protein YesL [Paenibacillus sediminis]